MIIDSHNHVYYRGFSPQAVIAECDRLGIQKTWLLTWYLPPQEDMPGYHEGANPLHLRPDGTHAAMPLSDVLAARDAYPDRFIAGYCPDPWHASAPALFEAAVRMHGVRVCGEWSYRMSIDDPRALAIFQAAGRLKCPVVLHMDVPFLPSKSGGTEFSRTWVAGTVAHLERALEACPETIFVGHAPGFWRDISGDAATAKGSFPTGPITPGGRVVELMERFPNLWADLSAGSGMNMLTRDTEFSRRFVERFADRLMFGRDRHGADLIEFLPTLGLSAATMKKIMGENAARLLETEP